MNTSQCSEKKTHQNNHRLLQTSRHAVTGQHTRPKGSVVTCSSSDLFISTWRVRWDVLTKRPSGSKNQRELFGFPSTARWTQPGIAAEWLDLKDYMLLERLQWHRCPPPTTENHLRGQTHYVWNLPEALQMTEPPPIGIYVCFETNIHYHIAFTSRTSGDSKAKYTTTTPIPKNTGTWLQTGKNTNCSI